MLTIEHITLSSGHTRRSPRAEVSEAVIDRIRAAIAEGSGDVGGGWTVRLVPGLPEGTAAYDLLHDGRRVVACYLGIARPAADEMWAQIDAVMPMLPGAVRRRPKRAPWLAVMPVPDPAVLADPGAFADILLEAGDLERCVAWAIIDAV